jgi:Flp pilus assembly protein TadD
MEEAVVPRNSLPAPPTVEPVREVAYREAENAYTERRYDDALDLFTLYTEQHPGNPWGHYMYGLSAWKAGSLGDAETGFRTALRIDPRHMKSHLNLARVLLDDDRPGEALAEATAATDLDSTRGEAYRLVGRAHHNLGQPEKAITAYRRAVSLDTSDVWAMNNLGLLLIERERFEEALLPLAGAVAIEPEVVIFQNNLGIALERTGRHEAAAEAFRAALRVDDSNQKVMANLTRVEERRNDPSIPPVDLGELASRFLNGIKGKGEESEPLVSEAQPE